MVNANENKWEPVKYPEPFDRIRATHEKSGSTIVGTIRRRTYRVLTGICDYGVSLSGVIGGEIKVSGRDWTFERAVPERTLPTEPGWYMRQSDDSSIYRLFVDAGHNWYSNDNITVSWTAVHKSDVPDDLVRLVPVTEVEAAAKRNHEAWNALEDHRRIGGQPFHGLINSVQKILDGRNKP